VLYPIIPQITTIIANELNIKFDKFPEGKKADQHIANAIMSFNRQVWKTKKEAGKGLRDPLPEYQIPSDLYLYREDLKAAHNIQ
jgi:hypothetical protein